MRLVRAEWSRLFARRFTRIMILVLLALVAFLLAGSALDSHRPTAADRAQAKVQYADQQKRLDQEKAACEEARSRGENIDDRFAANCDYARYTMSEDDFLPHPFTFRTDTPVFVTVFAGMLALFGFLVGASFVGAEWTSGGMANLLLWRPRRLVVLAAKLGTLLLCVLVTTTVATGALVGGFWLVARYRGVFGALTRGLWESLALTGVRSVAFGLLAAAVGFALASLGRHTAMALGVALGYALVVEFGARLVLTLLQVRNSDRYLLSPYLIAWLEKRYTIVAPDATSTVTYVITWQMSAAVLGAVALALVLLAFASMRRRDVA